MRGVVNVSEYESGEMSYKKMVKMFQRMINDGSVWKFQGSYGRQAMDLIESGDCILGKQGHHDYYGNYVPSRFQVKSGTKGSIAYARKARAWRRENHEEV